MSLRRQQALPCLGDADRVRLRESVNSRPTHKAQSIANRQNKKCALHPVSAGTSTRPPCTYSGRADDACTNLLGFFVRYVRSRGSMKLRRVAKPPTFIFYRAARTRHARLVRLTRARGRCFLRGRKALLNDFCRAFGHSKAR